MNVAEVGQEQRLFRDVLSLGGSANVVVKIGGLEDDGLVFDIIHIDIRDEDSFGLSSSALATFETKSGIGTAKGVVAHYDILHPTRTIRTDDESTMSMIHRIVLDKDVFAWTVVTGCLPYSAFHADAVVAAVDDIVDNEHSPALTDVDGITVLGIPRASHRYAVDDDIIAALGNKVEVR